MTVNEGMDNGAVRYVPTGDVAGRVIDGEALLVLPERGEAIVLNEVGSRIWELISQSEQVSKIVDIIIQEFDVTRETAKQDVSEFCADLERRGLVGPAYT